MRNFSRLIIVLTSLLWIAEPAYSYWYPDFGYETDRTRFTREHGDKPAVRGNQKYRLFDRSKTGHIYPTDSDQFRAAIDSQEDLNRENQLSSVYPGSSGHLSGVWSDDQFNRLLTLISRVVRQREAESLMNALYTSDGKTRVNVGYAAGSEFLVEAAIQGLDESNGISRVVGYRITINLAANESEILEFLRAALPVGQFKVMTDLPSEIDAEPAAASVELPKSNILARAWSGCASIIASVFTGKRNKK